MAYFEHTNCVQQFRNVFSSEVDVEENAEKILRKMKNVFQNCFKKIRITGKVKTKDEIIFFMEMKVQLKIKLKNTEVKSEIDEIQNQIRIIDNFLSLKCFERNKNFVNEYAQELNSEKATFSQHGLWKLKSKLCQFFLTPQWPKWTDYNISQFVKRFILRNV